MTGVSHAQVTSTTLFDAATGRVGSLTVGETRANGNGTGNLLAPAQTSIDLNTGITSTTGGRRYTGLAYAPTFPENGVPGSNVIKQVDIVNYSQNAAVYDGLRLRMQFWDFADTSTFSNDANTNTKLFQSAIGSQQIYYVSNEGGSIATSTSELGTFSASSDSFTMLSFALSTDVPLSGGNSPKGMAFNWQVKQSGTWVDVDTMTTAVESGVKEVTGTNLTTGFYRSFRQDTDFNFVHKQNPGPDNGDNRGPGGGLPGALAVTLRGEVTQTVLPEPTTAVFLLTALPILLRRARRR